MASDEPTVIDGLPSDLPPELNVLIGVFFLFWKIEELVDVINVTPPLSKNERNVLITLVAPRRMGALAADMQVLPSTLTTIADGLENKGLIARERDPQDRRAWQLRLTQAGSATRQDIIRKATQIFTEVSGLSRKETETISALMLKVARNIKANGLPEGAKPCH